MTTRSPTTDLTRLQNLSRSATDALVPAIRVSELKLPLDHTADDLSQAVCARLRVDAVQVLDLHVFKRSFDARKAAISAVYIVDVTLRDDIAAHILASASANPKDWPHVTATPDMAYRLPKPEGAVLKSRPVVVGFGPCGIFAALMLAKAGCKPIVIERGKPVRERTQDTWGLWRKRDLNEASNVQFGEGGAGTFSDGKLWSQIKDPRYLGRLVMQELVKAGAPPEILIDAHPHIGTFKLVKVVENLREQIIALGGEVRFGQHLVDIVYSKNIATNLIGTGGKLLGGVHEQISAILVKDTATGQVQELPCSQVVMALGHSARDTFAMLYERGVAMTAKPFSIGCRIEHPQSLIDQARWGRHAGHPALGAAEYRLVHHASNGRTVYSFCMCPGGTVVAATSEAGRVVTNGMSQYSRAERNANSGFVVGIDPADYPNNPTLHRADFAATLGGQVGERIAATLGTARIGHPADEALHHPLSGIVLQRQLETAAYQLGSAQGAHPYNAPAQRLGDFMAQKPSTALGEVIPSYKPGVTPVDLHRLLPDFVTTAMREAIPQFAKQIKGYDLPDAVLTAVETRTSSPLRIPRGDDFQSTNVRGLYPAGEGAGYAGGILSAAVDGIKVAEAVLGKLTSS